MITPPALLSTKLSFMASFRNGFCYKGSSRRFPCRCPQSILWLLLLSFWVFHKYSGNFQVTCFNSVEVEERSCVTASGERTENRYLFRKFNYSRQFCMPRNLSPVLELKHLSWCGVNFPREPPVAAPRWQTWSRDERYVGSLSRPSKWHVFLFFDEMTLVFWPAVRVARISTCKIEQ